MRFLRLMLIVLAALLIVAIAMATQIARDRAHQLPPGRGNMASTK